MNVIKVHEEAHNKGKKGSEENERGLFSVFLIYFICGHDFRVLSTIFWLIVILELNEWWKMPRKRWLVERRPEASVQLCCTVGCLPFVIYQMCVSHLKLIKRKCKKMCCWLVGACPGRDRRIFSATRHRHVQIFNISRRKCAFALESGCCDFYTVDIWIDRLNGCHYCHVCCAQLNSTSLTMRIFMLFCMPWWQL